jgi:hypothetical protein
MPSRPPIGLSDAQLSHVTQLVEPLARRSGAYCRAATARRAAPIGETALGDWALQIQLVLAPALVYYHPVEILLKHPLHRVAGGSLNRTEPGVQHIAVLFLEVVNDEIRVGNSLLAVGLASFRWIRS